MTNAPRLRVIDWAAFERPVTFRFPFRFGAADVTAAPQAFVRVTVEDREGRRAEGWAAEMMMPRWFDKSPELSVAQNIDQLRRALRLGLKALRDAGTDTAFGLHARAQPDHYTVCTGQGLNRLIASFGLALADRAVLDALCKLTGLPAIAALRANLPGIDARTTPDLIGFDLDRFLTERRAPDAIAARHTVGLGDILGAAEIENPVDDGLPQSLDQVIRTYGHRYFKLKLCGDPQTDLARLSQIVSVLDKYAPGYRATLDGNEQYTGVAPLAELLDGIAAQPGLLSLKKGLLFVEQPIARAQAMDSDVSSLAAQVALEIDESDADIDAFPRSQLLGYTGVSSKSCKGFYRALLNAARVARTEGLFMSAEDLTVQPGLALQQDLILAAVTGNSHVERNGHHFAGGMGIATDAEQMRYATTHPDLYHQEQGQTRLRIKDGQIALGSTFAAIGLGCALTPDIDRLLPLQESTMA
ncbi:MULTISPECIES: mandelate racemase [unclassified Yoonia]|uniref:mandelate racemase n=1 Tax=unclassified Yoonia TaxID=2629118 RepID=UPI002AFE6714|nr:MULTISPECIES: mandelate racemase [unclassified Yoonia]